MSRSSPSISILTSGVGLGTYVPALLNQRVLRDSGYGVDVELIEAYFTTDALARHLDHKAAFQENFELALVARRMTKDVELALDTERVDALLYRWARQDRSRFIVWSGFWISVLQRYIARVPHLCVEVDVCRIDAVASPSFRIQPRLVSAAWRDIWLWNWPERRVDWQIAVTGQAPVPMGQRPRRLLVHGGGWGVGPYADVLPELSSAGYALDVISPRAKEWAGRSPHDRRFTPAPGWHPWHRDGAGELAFPPLCEVARGRRVRHLRNQNLPPAHGLVRPAMAVVTKPGGGTLIDSLSAATPLVMLRPWGTSEARNADLWEELGFGVRFERWRQTGFDMEQLTRLHRNLLRARSAGRMYPPQEMRLAA